MYSRWLNCGRMKHPRAGASWTTASDIPRLTGKGAGRPVVARAPPVTVVVTQSCLASLFISSKSTKLYQNTVAVVALYGTGCEKTDVARSSLHELYVNSAHNNRLCNVTVSNTYFHQQGVVWALTKGGFSATQTPLVPGKLCTSSAVRAVSTATTNFLRIRISYRRRASTASYAHFRAGNIIRTLNVAVSV